MFFRKNKSMQRATGKTGIVGVLAFFNRGTDALVRHYREVAKWRSQYNPLRSLTMARAVSLLEEGQRGQYADLQWLYSFIEKREPTLRGLLKRRLAALGKLDWNVKCVADEDLPPGCDPKMAEAQRDFLRSLYDGIDNLRAAIDHLALAEFRGYAHLEKHIGADGQVTHLEPVDQWFFNRQDGIYGPWLYNAEAASTNSGELINPDDWVIREESWPINEVGLICFLRKTLSQKDWDGFVETYGIPPLFLIMPPNIPTEKEADYQAVAEQVMADARGALPNGSDVKTVDSGSRGTNPFREHLQYQDEQLVLAGTSGQLTMLSQPTGIGGSQGDNHQEAFEELAIAEAMAISEIFQKQIDEPALRAKFPGQRILAYWELAAKEETNVGDICAQAETLSRAGYKIEPAELEEKTGYKLTAQNPDLNTELTEARAAQASEGTEGEEDFSGRSANNQNPKYAGGSTSIPRASRGAAIPLNNRSAGRETPGQGTGPTLLQQAARQELGKAIAEDMQPIRKRLESILKIEDPEILGNRLQAFREELPKLLKDINADPASVRAFEGLLGAAVVNGIAESASQQGKEIRR